MEAFAKETGKLGEFAIGTLLHGFRPRGGGFDDRGRRAVGDAELDREDLLDRFDALTAIGFAAMVFGEPGFEVAETCDQSAGEVVGAISHAEAWPTAMISSTGSRSASLDSAEESHSEGG